MGLYLVEIELAQTTREAATAVIAAAAAQFPDDALVEAQVPVDHARAYLIVEGDACEDVVLNPAALPGAAGVTQTVPVRLVGATVEQIRERGTSAGYVVEWDIPAEITLEQYLARKQAKSPLYADLDDVTFLRTYVREDTEKCLCLYDAENEAAVRNAREYVATPISRLYALDAPLID